MKKAINDWTKDELLQLPFANFLNRKKSYSSVLIVSRGIFEESDLSKSAIIGVINGEPVEVATSQCEFIEWALPLSLGSSSKENLPDVHVRCASAAQSGALHVWMVGAKVNVGVGSDHTEISFVARSS